MSTTTPATTPARAISMAKWAVRTAKDNIVWFQVSAVGYYGEERRKLMEDLQNELQQAEDNLQQARAAAANACK